MMKPENMLLLDKVKNQELELSIAREQTNRSASSKLEHILSIQESPLDKIGLSFEDSIFVPKTHSTNFVFSFKPPVSEIVKPVEVTSSRKIRVDHKESNPKNPTIPKDKEHDRTLWVFIFVEKLDTFVETISSCKLLSKQISQKYLCSKYKISWYLLVSW